MPDRSVVHALGFSLWKRPLVRRFLNEYRIKFIRHPDQAPARGTLAVWASGPFRNCQIGNHAVKRLMLEDGFLRSVGLGADLVTPLSWIVDRSGIYYDSSMPSDLESILQSEQFDDAVLTRAATLRDTLLSTGVTKYNVGKTAWAGLSQEVMRRGKCVLVVGQVESDASLQSATSEIRSNLDLLRAARQMHPNGWLIYKPHPDVVAGLRDKGLGEDDASNWCDDIIEDAPMGRLLQSVDVVHVMTSLAGFEALLRGKRVVCHGTPFYAGWGLTEDCLPMPRRTRHLTLDELTAGVLIRYPRYVNRKGIPSTPEEVVTELLRSRRRQGSVAQLRRRAMRPILRVLASKRTRLDL